MERNVRTHMRLTAVRNGKTVSDETRQRMSEAQRRARPTRARVEQATGRPQPNKAGRS